MSNSVKVWQTPDGSAWTVHFSEQYNSDIETSDELECISRLSVLKNTSLYVAHVCD